MKRLAFLAIVLSAACFALGENPHQEALNRLAKASYVAFSVASSDASVALPEPGVEHPFIKGKVLLAKDGRWLWERDDGWAYLFDGAKTWKTAVASGWYEEVEAKSLSGGPVNTESLKSHLIGMEVFFNGKWKGVPEMQDWVGAGIVDGWNDLGRLVLVGRPKSRSQVSETRKGDPASGYLLYFDEKTLLPVAGETYSSSSYDRQETHAAYTEFVYDPPGAEAKLKKASTDRLH